VQEPRQPVERWVTEEEMWRVSIVLVTAIGFNILDSVIQDEE